MSAARHRHARRVLGDRPPLPALVVLGLVTALVLALPLVNGRGSDRPTAAAAPADEALDVPPVTRAPTPERPVPAAAPDPRAATAGPEAATTPAVRVPLRASGRLAVVPGSASAPGNGRVRRYVVEVERGLPFDAREFAAQVHATLNDPRGWGRGGRTMRFVRVSSGPAPLRIALTSPALTDKLCHLETRGIYSCAAPSRVLLNARRWAEGAPSYAGQLAAYRTYMVNHEVGHTLGRPHVDCPGKGRRAPVMMQQTKGIGACRANPFPNP